MLIACDCETILPSGVRFQHTLIPDDISSCCVLYGTVCVCQGELSPLIAYCVQSGLFTVQHGSSIHSGQGGIQDTRTADVQIMERIFHMLFRIS